MKYVCTCICALFLSIAGVSQPSVQGTASISGRVTDASGNPFPAQVQAYDIIIRDGIGSLYPKCHTTTHDGGGYECPNLPAGRYILQVRPLLPPNRIANHASSSLPAFLFYPNVTDLDLANIIVLKNGEQKWADFQLMEEDSVELAGVILNHTAEAALALKAQSGGRVVDTGIHIRYDGENGRFQVAAVPAGHYLITADWFIKGAEQKAALPITVGAISSRNLRLSAASAVEVSGRLHDLPDGVTVSEIRLIRADGSDGDVSTPVTGGAFHFHPVPPGDYVLSLPPNQASVYVDSLTVDDQSIDGPKFTAGQDQTRINVEVDLKGPALGIRGTVTPWDSAPAHAQVVALNEQSGQIYATITDAERRFSFKGLAPGAYRLYAIPGLDAVEYRNPGVLKRYEEDSAEVSIDEDSIMNTVELSPIERQR